MNYIFSIVIPVLNEIRRLPRALESIRKQEFNQASIEILVVDAGSTDGTQGLASQFGAKVLNNPKHQQEYAKHIGFCNAAGEYLIFLDADEVLVSPNALQSRLQLFQQYPDELALVLWGGYRKPPNSSAINDYINHYSDPFAFFLYGLSADENYIHKSWSKKYKIVEETPVGVIFDFSAQRALPLVDLCAGNAINRRMLIEVAPEYISDPCVVTKAFHLLISRWPRVALLKDNPTLHYSSETPTIFLRKLRWRIIANIHYPSIPGTGFANREEYLSRTISFKKYLFIPYALTLIIPFAQGFYHAFRKRKVILLIHGPLSLYVGILILYYYLLKVFRVSPQLGLYGKQLSVKKAHTVEGLIA